jgi:exosortase
LLPGLRRRGPAFLEGVTREGQMTQTSAAAISPNNRKPLAVLGAAVACTVWAFWTTLGQTALRWAQDPMYSHGYLVPGFALLLLWFRRDRLAEGQLRPSWWGAAVLLVGLGMRAAGSFFYFVWLDEVSLVPCLAGVVLMAGGWPAWRWAWPGVAFLLFMIPLPYRLSVAMTGPLQQLATDGSTFALQTFGLPALADGTVIRLDDVEINIVEACSGLRMLVIFFALSTAVALLMRRPLWQKLVVVGSAVPIALVVNVLRITVTGVMHETVGREAADAVFHDLAGWLMMPVALGFLGLELKLLTRLVIEPAAAGPRLLEGRKPLAQPVPAKAARGRPRARTKWQPLEAGSKPKGLS